MRYTFASVVAVQTSAVGGLAVRVRSTTDLVLHQLQVYLKPNLDIPVPVPVSGHPQPPRAPHVAPGPHLYTLPSHPRCQTHLATARHHDIKDNALSCLDVPLLDCRPPQ
jgi:hypothetical protein